VKTGKSETVAKLRQADSESMRIREVQCQYFYVLLLRHDITSTVEVMSSLESHYFDSFWS